MANELVDMNAIVPGANYTYGQLAQWQAMQNSRSVAPTLTPMMPAITNPTPNTGLASGTSKSLNLQITTDVAGGSIILGGYSYFGTSFGSQANATLNVLEFDSANYTQTGFTAISDAVMLSQAFSFCPMVITKISVSGASGAIQQNQGMDLRTTKIRGEFAKGSLQTIQNFQPQLQQNQYQAGVIVYDWQNGVCVDTFTYLVLPLAASQTLTINIEYSNIVDFAYPRSVMNFADKAKTTKQGM